MQDKNNKNNHDVNYNDIYILKNPFKINSVAIGGSMPSLSTEMKFIDRTWLNGDKPKTS
jgi:hypothetical protein